MTTPKPPTPNETVDSANVRADDTSQALSIDVSQQPTIDSQPSDTPPKPAVIQRPQLPSVTIESGATPSNDSILLGNSDKLLPLREHQLGERFELGDEIARGGMGAVHLGTDRDLNREIAIKVMLTGEGVSNSRVTRFIEEAQIGGQLQHPGIPPVYEMGRFDDGRLFFAMKLVRGRTLAEILKQRADTHDDLSSLLGIFEQICQTIAFAHTHGVIHRDLKPANVMVGAFGEVQVMDWGLAKILNDSSKSMDHAEDDRTIETIKSIRSDDSSRISDDTGRTQLGSIIGTPAYMPPEQAQGRIDQIDERADVFGLGAILCEILTARTPYAGDGNKQNVLARAQRGDPTTGMASIEAAAVDDDLKRLAQKCLQPTATDRFANAAMVARSVTTHLEGVANRLREAQQEQMVASAKAAEQAKRRRLMLALAASVIGFMTLGAIGYGVSQKRQTRLANEKAGLLQKQVSDAVQIQTQNEQIIAANEDLAAATKQAELTLADMQTERGIFAARSGEASEAPLWFSAAARQASGDPNRVQTNLIRARNWMNTLSMPVRQYALPVEGERITRIEFQPGGELLAIVRSGDLIVWDWQNDETIGADWGQVTRAGWRSDGRGILVYDESAEQLRQYDAVTWNASVLFEGEEAKTKTEELIPNRPSSLAKLIGGQTIQLYKNILYQLVAGERQSLPMPTLPMSDGSDAKPDNIRKIFTSPSGRYLVGCQSLDGQLFRFNEDDNQNLVEEIQNLSHGSNEMVWAAFADDESVMMTVGWDQQARLWSLPEGEPIGTPIIHPGVLMRCTMNDDGSLFATVDRDGQTRVYQRNPTHVLQLMSDRFTTGSKLSHDGRYVLPSKWKQDPHGGGGKRTQFIFDCEQQKSLESPKLTGTTIECARNDPAESFITLHCNGEKHDAVVWRWNDDTTAKIIATIELPKHPFAIASHPTKKEAAIMLKTGRLLLLDLETNAIRKRLPLEDWATSDRSWPELCYTPSGESLALLTGGKLNRVEVLRADTLQRRFPPIRPVLQDGPCRVMEVSPSGDFLATGVNGINAVQVWDLQTGEPVCNPLLHPGDLYGVYCLHFSADEKRIVSGSKDGQVRVWDIETEQLAGPALQHPDEVWALAFTANGETLCTGTRNGQVRLWDLPSGKLIAPPIQCDASVTGFQIANSSDELFVTTSERRVADGDPPQLLKIDLTGFLSPPEVELGRMQTIAELMSGRTLVQETSVLTDGEAWQKSLEKVVAATADFGQLDPDKCAARKRAVADAAYEKGRYATAAANWLALRDHSLDSSPRPLPPPRETPEAFDDWLGGELRLAIALAAIDSKHDQTSFLNELHAMVEGQPNGVVSDQRKSFAKHSIDRFIKIKSDENQLTQADKDLLFRYHNPESLSKELYRLLGTAPDRLIRIGQFMDRTLGDFRHSEYGICLTKYSFALGKRKQFKSQLNLLERCREVDSDNLVALRQKAMVLKDLNHHDELLATYRELAEKDQGSLRSSMLIDYAFLPLQRHRIDTAIDVARRHGDGVMFRTLVSKAEEAEKGRRYDRAIQVRKVLEVVDDDPIAHQRIIRDSLERSGRPKEALTYARRIFKNSNDIDDALKLSDALKINEMWVECENVTRHELERQLGRIPLTINQGLAVQEQGRLEEALQIFDSIKSAYWSNRYAGEIHLKAERFSKAIDRFRLALELQESRFLTPLIGETLVKGKIKPKNQNEEHFHSDAVSRLQREAEMDLPVDKLNLDSTMEVRELLRRCTIQSDASRFALIFKRYAKKYKLNWKEGDYYNAACMAVLAAVDMENVEETSDESSDLDATKSLQLATTWLNRSLDFIEPIATGDDREAASETREGMLRWLVDEDLHAIRGDQINELPKLSRQAIRDLWKRFYHSFHFRHSIIDQHEE